jgi:hypothetical protein
MYERMRDIGKLYGISSHKVGKELKDLGYRDESGKPTQMARGLGLVREVYDGEHPEWLSFIWNVAKVSELLEDFGYRRVEVDE